MPVPLGISTVSKALKSHSSKDNFSVFTPTSGLSDRYQTLSDANPYANVSYRTSWLQDLLSRLGFRTGKDAYLDSMALQAKEYDSAVLQKQADEAYNDPSAQASRLRAAGINPDLSGNVSPGESSPLQDDGNPPIAPVAEDLDMIRNFASTVIQAAQLSFSLVSGVTDIKGKILDNRNKQLDQIGKDDQLAFNALLNVLPGNSDEPLDYNQLYSQFKRAYGGHIKKRYFPAFVDRALAFQNGLAFEDVKYSKSNNRAGNRKTFYIKTSGSDYSEENQAMKVISKSLSDLSLAVFEATSHASIDRSKADSKKAGNDIKFEDDVRPVLMDNQKRYNESLDPEGMAANEMSIQDEQLAILRNQRIQSDLERAMHDSYRDIYKSLQDLEDDGNWYAPYLKAALSLLLLNNLPSFPITINTGPRNYSFGQ